MKKPSTMKSTREMELWALAHADSRIVDVDTKRAPGVGDVIMTVGGRPGRRESV
jgi:hypothetical protein